MPIGDSVAIRSWLRHNSEAFRTLLVIFTHIAPESPRGGVVADDFER